MADGPVLVLDDNDSPTVVVVQNDLIRYLFADDDEIGEYPPDCTTQRQRDSYDAAEDATWD